MVAAVAVAVAPATEPGGRRQDCPDHAPMHLTTKFGIGLLVLGGGIYAAWNLWTQSRIAVPVNLPVSLAAGQTVTADFALNFDALYLIKIQAQKTIPVEALHCLMGVDSDPTRCGEFQTVIGVDWILSCGGKEMARGTSGEEHSAPSESQAISREIGEFHGKAGQRCNLRVIFTKDGTRLAPAHPRLLVGVQSMAYEDIRAAGVLVFSATFICIMFGLILLGIAFFARLRPSA